ncbi:MAG: CotH kinase family protein [Oscillospiraceae bacterium]
MKKIKSSREGNAIALVTLLVAAVFGIVLLNGHFGTKSTSLPYEKAPEAMPNMPISKDNTVSADFISHLPLIILQIGEEDPRSDSLWDVDKGYQMPVDFDPYVSGEIKLIAGEEGVNCLSDTATMKSKLKIRLRGNSSADFDKKQYLLKLYNEDGSKNKQDILGMGKDWEWVLNVSFIDKSLMRNYAAYTMGKQLNVASPDAEYCEVFRQRGEVFEYMGVYLIMENVERSNDRVDIPKYSEKSKNVPYILRRDRFDGMGVMLPLNSTANKQFYGSVELKYPKRDMMSQEDFDKIVEEVNTIERTLLSDVPREYLNYSKLLNVDSFVDYFILNELLMNYDAGFRSTYSYKSYDGKLTMGPFWDFDQSLDNDPIGRTDLHRTAMQEAAWFRQLLRDPAFVSKVIERYSTLRDTCFSNEAFEELIDNTAIYLGTGAERDWNRWGYHYRSDYLKEKNVLDTSRNVKSYKAELKRIKYAYNTHADWLDKNIEDLYMFCDDKIPAEVGEEISAQLAGQYSQLMAFVFILIFLISAVLIRREA